MAFVLKLLGLFVPVLTVPKPRLLTKHFCCILLTGWMKEKYIMDNLFLKALLSMLPKLSSFSLRCCFPTPAGHTLLRSLVIALYKCVTMLSYSLFAYPSSFWVEKTLHYLQSLPTVPQKYSRVYTLSNKALEPPNMYFSLACLLRMLKHAWLSWDSLLAECLSGADAFNHRRMGWHRLV